MSSMWILVADASRARIFSSSGRIEESSLLQELEHAESREKGRELASDRPGHYQSHGDGHGSFVSGVSPRDFEEDRFAHQLAAQLNHARATQDFSQLLIVAPPRFHGLLRTHMDEHTRATVCEYIDKDYSQMEQRDLLARLAELYHSAAV